MSKINLKKLLSKKEISALLETTIETMGTSIVIQDLTGNIIKGESTVLERKYPIQVEEETVGWVWGDEKAEAIAKLASYIASKQLEEKALADEVLKRYKEISLLHRISENLTAHLDFCAISETIIDEVNKQLKTTGGYIVWINKQQKSLEIIWRFGTGEKLALKSIIGLDEGITGSIFTSGKGEIVNQAFADPRYLKRLDPGKNTVQALMGVPLKTQDRVLGVLVIGNENPVDYTTEDLQLLTIIASQAAQAIENVILHNSEIRSAIARNELEKGQQMQKDFLPDRLPKVTGWEIAAFFQPARQVAGDFYDAFVLDGDYVGLAIADVCDKGVGAALFMALFRSLVRVFSGQTYLPGLEIDFDENEGTTDIQVAADDQRRALQAVELTNDYIAQNHWQTSMFATLFFGVLDPKTGLLSYINGGHEPLFIINASRIKKTLAPTGPAVGMMPNAKYKIEQVTLDVGDILIGYTDGVTEAKSPAGELFTNKRLRLLLEQPAASVSELMKQIETKLFAYVNDAPQFDDITMLGVQRCPK